MADAAVEPKRTRIPWRKNVLLLLALSYLSVLYIFTLLALDPELDVGVAFEIVEQALMAVIIGSVAMAKDLIPFRDGAASKSPDEG